MESCVNRVNLICCIMGQLLISFLDPRLVGSLEPGLEAGALFSNHNSNQLSADTNEILENFSTILIKFCLFIMSENIKLEYIRPRSLPD